MQKVRTTLHYIILCNLKERQIGFSQQKASLHAKRQVREEKAPTPIYKNITLPSKSTQPSLIPLLLPW